MENFLLATVLFLVYFSVACCLLHNPAPAGATASLQGNGGELNATIHEHSELTEAIADEGSLTLPDTLLGANIHSSVETGITEPTFELLGGLNLDQLQLRPARRIAGRLGIRQKEDGEDKRLPALRDEIKKRFATSPLEVASIILQVVNSTRDKRRTRRA